MKSWTEFSQRIWWSARDEKNHFSFIQISAIRRCVYRVDGGGMANSFFALSNMFFFKHFQLIKIKFWFVQCEYRNDLQGTDSEYQNIYIKKRKEITFQKVKW